jgi:hypothetical protein
MQSEPKSAAEDPESPSQASPPLSGEEYQKYAETTQAPADMELEEAHPFDSDKSPLAEKEPQEARGEPGSSGYGGEADPTSEQQGQGGGSGKTTDVRTPEQKS